MDNVSDPYHDEETTVDRSPVFLSNNHHHNNNTIIELHDFDHHGIHVLHERVRIIDHHEEDFEDSDCTHQLLTIPASPSLTCLHSTTSDAMMIEFPSDCMDHLSDDVLFHIFSFLAVRSDLLSLSRVNHRFYQVSSHPSLWKLCLSVPAEKHKLKNFNMLYSETTRFDSANQLPVLNSLNSKRELIEYKRRRWRHMDGIEYAYRAHDEIRGLTKGANSLSQTLIWIVTCLLPCMLALVFVLYGLLWDHRISNGFWFGMMLIVLCVAVVLNAVTVVLCALHFGYVPCCGSFLLRYSLRNHSRSLNFERFRAIFFREGVDPLSNIHCLFFEPLTAWIWVLLLIIVFKSHFLGEQYVWSYVVIPVYITMAIGLMEPCFRSIHYHQDRRHYPYCDPFHSFYHMLIIATLWVCISISIALITAKLDNPLLYSWSVVLSAIYVPLMCITLLSIILMMVTLKRKYFPNQEGIILLLQPFACVVCTSSTFCFVITILLCLRLNGSIALSFFSILASLGLGICCCSTIVCLGSSIAFRSSTGSRIVRQYV